MEQKHLEYYNMNYLITIINIQVIMYRKLDIIVKTFALC